MTNKPRCPKCRAKATKSNDNLQALIAKLVADRRSSESNVEARKK